MNLEQGLVGLVRERPPSLMRRRILWGVLVLLVLALLAIMVFFQFATNGVLTPFVHGVASATPTAESGGNEGSASSCRQASCGKGQNDKGACPKSCPDKPNRSPRSPTCHRSRR